MIVICSAYKVLTTTCDTLEVSTNVLSPSNDGIIRADSHLQCCTTSLTTTAKAVRAF
jgi:hypothetical protein